MGHVLQWVHLQGRVPFKVVRGQGHRWQCWINVPISLSFIYFFKTVFISGQPVDMCQVGIISFSPCGDLFAVHQ